MKQFVLFVRCAMHISIVVLLLYRLCSGDEAGTIMAAALAVSVAFMHSFSQDASDLLETLNKK